MPSASISASPTASTRPSFRSRAVQISRAPAGGLRMKSIETFVVTASACGPMRDSTARYIATSASANIVGPDTVPPGRKCRSAAFSSTRTPSTITSSTVKSSAVCGNSALMNVCSAPASIAGASVAIAMPFLLPCCARRRAQRMQEDKMDAPVLTRETRGHVAEITLDRPGALNALSDALLAALAAELAALAEDRDIRAVILKGAGKAFCAGHDLREMQAGRQAEDGGRAYFADLFARCGAVMQAIRALPQPVIAQVHGI